MDKQSQSDSQPQRNMSKGAPSQVAAGAAAQRSQPQQQSSAQSQPSHQQGKAEADPSESSSAGEQIFDPVCGMEVDLEDEMTERFEHDGTVYYFCSADCREQYEASPDDFDS